MGYNGLPKGCSDDEFPWVREGAPLENKYFYTTHSELNAILNYRGGSLEGAKMYVSLFPCNECAKAIIQAGIKTIVYDSDKYQNTPAVIASKKDVRCGRRALLSVHPHQPGNKYYPVTTGEIMNNCGGLQLIEQMTKTREKPTGNIC